MWAGNLDPRGIGGEEPQEANTATQTATNFLSIIAQPTPPSLSSLDLVLCIAISDGHSRGRVPRKKRNWDKALYLFSTLPFFLLVFLLDVNPSTTLTKV